MYIYIYKYIYSPNDFAPAFPYREVVGRYGGRRGRSLEVQSRRTSNRPRPVNTPTSHPRSWLQATRGCKRGVLRSIDCTCCFARLSSHRVSEAPSYLILIPTMCNSTKLCEQSSEPRMLGPIPNSQVCNHLGSTALRQLTTAKTTMTTPIITREMSVDNRRTRNRKANRIEDTN